MSHLIQYIENNGLHNLQEELGIVVKEYDDYLVFNYSQIDTPKSSYVGKECRGTILRKSDLKIVCRPFDRFFNLGEGQCPEDIDFSKCQIAEKVDGSLIKVWWNELDDRWEIATRGTAFGESNVFDWPFTFREMFLREVPEFKSLTSYFYKDYTYLFELACPENRVVTPYQTPQVVFLTSRHNQTGKYFGDWNLTNTVIRKCNYWNLSSEKEIVKAAQEMKGLEEGFVVYRDRVPICKIKSPLYVKVHHIRGEGLTVSKVVNLVWDNEVDEYLTYFSEDKKSIDPYSDALKRLHDDIQVNVELSNRIENQKEFALAIQNSPAKGISFQLRKGKALSDVFPAVTQRARQDILTGYLLEKL